LNKQKCGNPDFSSLSHFIIYMSFAANCVRLLGEREVKGFALKTHKGLRPLTLQAFEKA